ncbi:MAG: hypothetical protein CMN76_10000 [Spirochaetaceae bacterium]|nr:hypothetical protein [Spirochaetaceae bacterium]|tara:strand:- start:19737 stop:20753 length:1017 start_codon:yes stop_codon:yes gene_type:complete
MDIGSFPPGPWQGYLVIGLMALIFLAWLYLIFCRILISQIKRFFLHRMAQESGDLITGHIIESETPGKGSPPNTGAGLHRPVPMQIKVEFPNFAGTMIQQQFQFTDTRPEQGRFGKGRSIQLRLLGRTGGARNVVLATGRVSVSWKFWLVYLMGLALYLGLWAYSANRVWVEHSRSVDAILLAASKVDVMGMLVGLGIGGGITGFVLSTFFKAFKRNGQDRLRWHGLKATASIEKVERTGVTVNDQPQIAFHYRFRASDGQLYSGQSREIVDLLDIGKLDEIKEKEILYLPEDPHQSLFLEQATAGRSGLVLILKGVLYFVALIFSIVLAGTVFGQLL